MGNYAIIESGSTKTDWAFVIDGQSTAFSSVGINGTTGVGLNESLPLEISLQLKKVNKIYFYGAGSNTNEAELRLRHYFNPYILPECIIFIYSDLLGAARAVAGNASGIVAIMGTGSHSCIYDGHSIIDQIPSLGYVISDEGSGNHIGKEIIKAYFYRQMSNEDETLFKQKYDLHREDVLIELYKGSKPAAYLASFAPFLQNCSESFKQKTLHKVFDQFIEQRIKNYVNYRNFDIYFVGSIAKEFEKELKLEFESQDLHIKQIIKTPLQNLIAFHNE